MVAGAGLAGGLWYLRLMLARAGGSEAAERSHRGLEELADALQAHAEANLGRFPARLSELSEDLERRFVYRPTPNRSFDERLIVAYDRTPQHKLLDFPVLRDGRAALLLGGRRLVFSSEEFEKFVAADNALRERQGLGTLDVEPP